MIKKRIRHAHRYQEILNAFIKNGLNHFLFRLGLVRAKQKDSQEKEIDMNLQDIGMKLCKTFQELGPTFIKLGQIASTRHDLIPKEIASELEKLQNEVSPFSFEKVRNIVEEELGDSLHHFFQDFDGIPLATASIGQVHIAKLPSGEEVAVKVQRPDIQSIFTTDLEILHDFARQIEKRFGWAKTYHIREMVDEFSTSLRDELDYEMEGRNGEQLAEQFVNNSMIHIPKVYWDYTTKKVLTMERINGIKVSHVEQLDEEGYDREVIAERLADSMFSQALEYGLFHGDPHPGNIYILPNNVVAYLDFGMVGQLRGELKYHFASLLIHLQQGNSKGILKTFSSMGILGEETDTVALHKDLDRLQNRYYRASFKGISLGEAITEIFSIGRRHHVAIPTDITILIKAILTLEETIKKLDPQFSVMKAVQPFGEKLIRERFQLKNILEHSWEEMVENVEIIKNLPKDLREMSSTIKKGKLRFDININDLPTFLRRLDKISNRLSFSIILLSFSILMVGLIIGSAIAGQTTLFWSLPIIEIGSIIATFLFLFLIYSIIRSGRM